MRSEASDSRGGEPPTLPRFSAGCMARIVSELARIALPWYAVCTAGRAVLWVWQHDRLVNLDLGTQWMAFVHGLRMDTIFRRGFLIGSESASVVRQSSRTGTRVRRW